MNFAGSGAGCQKMGNTNLILNIYIWRPIAVVPRPVLLHLELWKHLFACLFALSKTNAWCQSIDQISSRTVSKCRHFDNFLLFFQNNLFSRSQQVFSASFIQKSPQAENSLKEKKDYTNRTTCRADGELEDPHQVSLHPLQGCCLLQYP